MEYDYRDILKVPPGPQELESLAQTAGLTVKDLVNQRSPGYRKLGVNLEEISQEEAGQMMVDNPRIIIRPILTDGQTLVLGFRPEEMEDLIS